MLIMALVVSPLVIFLCLRVNPYPLVFRCLGNGVRRCGIRQHNRLREQKTHADSQHRGQKRILNWLKAAAAKYNSTSLILRIFIGLVAGVTLAIVPLSTKLLFMGLFFNHAAFCV